MRRSGGHSRTVAGAHDYQKQLAPQATENFALMETLTVVLVRGRLDGSRNSTRRRDAIHHCNHLVCGDSLIYLNRKIFASVIVDHRQRPDGRPSNSASQHSLAALMCDRSTWRAALTCRRGRRGRMLSPSSR